ncbi:MAG: GNAT family N-acetyltransferase [Hoeflea sp.]|uniref:GNAT family N-acetyltransferase n=1 Tax=Hoeflea sp. TaxID=1940281 RepID=UPI0032EFD110
MTLEVRPATGDNWPELEALFGPQGACYGCWCSHFRLEPKLRQAMDREERKALLKAATEAAMPPGLIAFEDGRPVGWVQVTPRSHVPRWNTNRTVSRPLDADDPEDPGLWAISCFFVTSRKRGQGLSHALVKAAVAHAATSGARVVDACPIAHAKHPQSPGLFTGSVAVFEKAGFSVVAERKPGRPLMRKILRPAA